MDAKSRPDAAPPSSTSSVLGSSSTSSRVPVTMTSGTRLRGSASGVSRSGSKSGTTTTPGMQVSGKEAMRSGSGSGSGSRIRPPGVSMRPNSSSSSSSNTRLIGSSTSTSSSSSASKSHNAPNSQTQTGDPDTGDSEEYANVKMVYDRFRALGMPEGVSVEALGRVMGVGVGVGAGSGGGVGSGNSKEDNVRLGSRSRGREPQKQKQKQKEEEQQKKKEEQQQQQQQRGEWNTALTFLSTHLVGRQEARRVRGVISRAREELAERSSGVSVPSKLKAPSSGTHAPDLDADPLLDRMALAARKRDMAYRALEAARREWEGVSAGVRELGTLRLIHPRGRSDLTVGFFVIPDVQRKGLADRVAERRRVLLLLGVLERREEVRVRRLGGSVGGMGARLDELKKRSALAMREFEALVLSSTGPSPSPNQVVTTNATNVQRLREKVGKYRNTTEALARLHAHHHRRLAAATRDGAAGGRGTGGPGIGKPKSESGAVGTEDVEARLEDVLRRLGMEGKALDGMKEQLRAVALRRAEARLEALVCANEEKRRQVQEKINRAVGLGWLCEEYIELISTFRKETAKDLRTMLDEEGLRVVGYVDTLRETIREREREGWVDDVRDALGSSRVQVWDEVRERVEAVHRSQALMAAGARVSIQDIEVGSVTARTEMMERKGRKAHHGSALAAEIKGLLQDIR